MRTNTNHARRTIALQIACKLDDLRSWNRLRPRTEHYWAVYTALVAAARRFPVKLASLGLALILTTHAGTLLAAPPPAASRATRPATRPATTTVTVLGQRVTVAVDLPPTIRYLATVEITVTADGKVTARTLAVTPTPPADQDKPTTTQNTPIADSRIKVEPDAKIRHRCKAIAVSTGKQCKNYSVDGQEYCWVHLERAPEKRP